MKNTSISSTMFLALLLLLLITTSQAEAIHVKRTCNSTIAGCIEEEEEWSHNGRRLLQSSGSVYGSLQKQPPCATSRGGAYTNRCFKPVNKPTRPCIGYYQCRSST
ncbi:hypothetical protein QJS10_CPB04g01292 [Acorus calamus]|uniref:Uncharacterized protein n=1 Tax=Acorus calamus TaxID=4465 RepID=A0AAV9EZM6_ACOCL|nr:hypothetical protein QJS10_CPB04g01292 [Acorus calamus]